MKTTTKQHKDVFFTEYKGIKYPMREIKWSKQMNNVATQSLNDALYNKGIGKYKSNEAKHIDDSILIFVEEEEINLPKLKLEKLVKELLS